MEQNIGETDGTLKMSRETDGTEQMGQLKMSGTELHKMAQLLKMMWQGTVGGLCSLMN